MFGLGMNGLEDAITAFVVETRRLFNPCTYLEIGVAGGMTLSRVASLMSAGGQGWRAIGVELPNGYSFNRSEVDQNCGGQHFNVAWITPNGWNKLDPVWNRVSVVLTDVRDFFEGMWQEPIHIALIDGCHCHECVMRDFRNVEKYMPQNGAVMLHDFDPAIDAPQPHGDHCDVFGACKELGLVNHERTGWGAPLVMAAAAGGANMLAVRKTTAQ